MGNGFPSQAVPLSQKKAWAAPSTSVLWENEGTWNGNPSAKAGDSVSHCPLVQSAVPTSLHLASIVCTSEDQITHPKNSQHHILNPTPRSPMSLHPAALPVHILLPVVPHPAAPFTHILLPVFPHPASYSRASRILQPVFPYPASLQLCTPQPCISASLSPVSLHLVYMQLCIFTSSYPTAPYSHIL